MDVVLGRVAEGEKKTVYVSCYYEAVLLFSGLNNTPHLVPYSPVCQMDFTSAKKKRRDLMEKGIVPYAQRVIGISGARAVAPTLSEKEEFYKRLAKGKTKPAVLSLLPEHNNAYVPICRSH